MAKYRNAEYRIANGRVKKDQISKCRISKHKYTLRYTLYAKVINLRRSQFVSLHIVAFNLKLSLKCLHASISLYRQFK